MPDMIGTSLTGLIAYQQALNTTSHNISNAQTEGYSRQRVDFAARQPTALGFGYVGSGVQVSSISRVYDSFMTQQARVTASNYQQLDAYHTLAARIDNMLADPQVGLTSSLQSFFGSVQDVANDPSSVPARQAMLAEAGQLEDRFSYLNGRLTALDSEVNSRLTSITDEVNSLTNSIATLNLKNKGVFT